MSVDAGVDNGGIKVSVILPRWALAVLDQRARRQGLARSAMLRVIVLEWLGQGPRRG